MKKPDVWMPLYVADYRADTGHLRVHEHGAYLLMLMHYWRNGPLLDDDKTLAALALMTTEQWAECASTLRAFFEAKNGRLHQKRIDREIADAKVITAKKRKAANTRWSRERDKEKAEKDHENQASRRNADADARALLTQSPSPSPSPKEEAAASSSGKSREADDRPPVAERPIGFDLPDRGAMGVDSWREENNVKRPVVEGYFLDSLWSEVLDAGRLNEAQFPGDWRPLIAWLRDGFTPDVILAAVRRAAKRPGYPRIKSLSYFDQAIREKAAA